MSEKLRKFVANFFAGAVFVFGMLWFGLLEYGFDFPNYYGWVIWGFATLGVFISELLNRKLKLKFHLFNPVIFVVLELVLLFVMGVEDWVFVLNIGVVAFIYAIVPALVVVGLGRKF